MSAVTFTEKSAWVMLVALLMTGSMYVAPVIMALLAGGVVPPPGPFFIMFVIVLVVLAIIGHILVAVANPKEANQSLDERDRNIAYKAGHWSGMVFGFLVVTGLLGYLVLRNGDWLFHFVFAALVISQMVEYAIVIFVYRRGY